MVYVTTAGHDWGKMVSAIQDYIKSLNFGYRSALIQKGVTYSNAYAQFLMPNKVKVNIVLQQWS
jgi:pyruvate/2-oxoglutarate dehydrogenase complex dihydrolipoamide dehydrogenase (E3) component